MLPEKHSNMAVNVAVVKHLVAVKCPQVAVNFGDGGIEGLPGPGNTADEVLIFK